MRSRYRQSLLTFATVVALVSPQIGHAQQSPAQTTVPGMPAPGSQGAMPMPAPGSQGAMPMPGMPTPGMPTPGMPAPGSQGAMQMMQSHREMMQSMEKMNRDMTGATMTGDPDRDLVTMMMPHHQSAIDMARIYLRDGKDPTIRKMAQKIIVDQERENKEFKAWLAKHPAPSR